MFKKGFVALLLSVLLAVMVGTTAFAEEAVITPEIAQALSEVEQVNAEIYGEIAKGQVLADQLYEEYLLAVNEAGETAQLKADYEKKLTKIISEVDVKTQEITRHGVEKARESGLNVEIEWIPVQFADRIALIDPIRVVSW
ncbi:hypothetical protein BN1080_00537 [Planococcus massiliensis]|uniref:Uncharacterized protein n=1 Tax=Planococcus massiliensis TaxID=1499687 RepID=A0A098EH50_9BACL|nr:MULTISPECIES: hypothetical protein [Planococcus]MCJ1907870.1 hypothetical protein [Planococcus ruber]CEG21624.1 hypothetical protein BN1080_00537 [Planococcus massiliensis]